jgi:hypothetical protein
MHPRGAKPNRATSLAPGGSAVALAGFWRAAESKARSLGRRDGLAELLLRKGYEVHRIKRRASLFNAARVDHLYHDPHEADVSFRLHYGDLTGATNLIRIAA